MATLEEAQEKTVVVESDARWKLAFEELLKEQNKKAGYRPIIPFASKQDGTLDEKETLRVWLQLIK